MSGLARQGATFAVVGAVATGVHICVALAARHLVHASPLHANFAGYVSAVAVSYFGNARLTFGAATWHGPQIARFLAVSLAGLALGQAITWLLVTRLGLPFWVGLGGVVVGVPALTFVVSRAWTFRPAKA